MVLGSGSNTKLLFKSPAADELRPFPFSLKWSQHHRSSASVQPIRKTYSPLHPQQMKRSAWASTVCNVSLFYEMSSKGLNCKFLFLKGCWMKNYFLRNTSIFFFNHLMWETGNKWKFLSFFFFFCLFNIKEAFHVIFLCWCLFSHWLKHRFLSTRSSSEPNEKTQFSDAVCLNGLSSINRLLASTASRHPKRALFRQYHRHHSSSWWVVLTPPAEMRLCLTSTLILCAPLCL